MSISTDFAYLCPQSIATAISPQPHLFSQSKSLQGSQCSWRRLHMSNGADLCKSPRHNQHDLTPIQIKCGEFQSIQLVIGINTQILIERCCKARRFIEGQTLHYWRISKTLRIWKRQRRRETTNTDKTLPNKDRTERLSFCAYEIFGGFKRHCDSCFFLIMFNFILSTNLSHPGFWSRTHIFLLILPAMLEKVPVVHILHEEETSIPETQEQYHVDQNKPDNPLLLQSSETVL